MTELTCACLLHANCTPVTGPPSLAGLESTSLVGAASSYIDLPTCINLSHHITNLYYAV